MLLHAARIHSRTIAVFLVILPLAGCVNGSDPLAPAGTSGLTFADRVVELPLEEQLSGAYRCVEALVVPEKSSSVRVKYATFWFHEGAVSGPLRVEVCAERSVYSIELYPGGSTLLEPVDVRFGLRKDLFTEGEIERLKVLLVTDNGLFQEIPSELVVKGSRVDVHFQVDHFSRYALVLD